ncbi:MAG TPA: MmgE/PrpD family protein [Micropepsaceae bacterium]|nr:MmgE/PrpD family protein [Micropepsaceae bacterium]
MTAPEEQSATVDTIRALAHAVHNYDVKDVAAAAMHQAQLLLLDTIGCGIAALHDDVARGVADVVLHDSGSTECPLIGRPQRTSILNAVLLNGVAIRVVDLNDYAVDTSKAEPETAGHPSDNIPVALALAAARGRSGAAMLAAIVLGYELYARLQKSMNRAGAWDGVTITGLVAPAMAGWLMGLDEDKLGHALAFGAARAATPAIVRTGHISSAKSIANALVAQSGVQAALLAEAGLTGPLAILDDARGLRDLFARGYPSLLTEALPSTGAIMRAHVKAYPCINTAQGAVAAALKLRAMLNGPAETLSHIEIVMADYAIVKRQQEDEARAWPQSREAADHSFPFLVAVTLLDGAFGPEQFENERWHDPHVKVLMEKITMRRDAGWNARAPGAFPCTLRAQTREDRDIMAEIVYPPGFSKNGLDETAVIEKFHAVTAPLIDKAARARIVDAVMEFHHSRTTAALETAIAIEGASP